MLFSNNTIRQKVVAAASCCNYASFSQSRLIHALSRRTKNNNALSSSSSSSFPIQSSSVLRFLSSSTTDHQSLIINAVGTDRLGIVHDMTQEVIDAGGNVGASQAAKLGKYFSLMMLVEVPTKEITTLTTNLQKMKDLSATVHHQTTEEETSSSTTSPASSSTSSYAIGYTGHLSLEGADNPGIVHKVTKILSSNGLNIDRMETTDEIAPNGGSVLFRMKGIAHAYEPLSSGFDAGKIRDELTQLGDDLNCDIDLIDGN